jgi:hypothetical protein
MSNNINYLVFQISRSKIEFLLSLDEKIHVSFKFQNTNTASCYSEIKNKCRVRVLMKSLESHKRINKLKWVENGKSKNSTFKSVNICKLFSI